MAIFVHYFINMINKEINILEISKLLNEKYDKVKPYSLKDLGVNHRLLTYWDEKDLLLNLLYRDQ